MAKLDLPSEEALAAIGRAQLEYVLKVIYKRTSGEPLSLGGLLFGQYESGENKKFEGLINLAKRRCGSHFHQRATGQDDKH